MTSVNRQSHIPSVKKTLNRDFYSNVSNNFLAPSAIKPSNKYESKPNSFGFNSAYKSQFAVPSSMGPFSTAKKPFLNSRIPSTIKSVNRGKITTFSNSVQKQATKLFGMTPQTNRLSLLQSVSSTTRLSRASSLSGASRPSTGSRQKDNRMLSDPTYQRECQEMIVDFLTMNGYPGQITRQNLVRLSLSDASKIFQFLFNFYDENIIIRNGIDTSLDAVVPRMMPIFCYPYPIKKSDLVSFSGGRQLGSVLSMMEYLIDFITYYSNVEMSRIICVNNFGSYEEEMDDEETNLNKLLPKNHDIVQQLDWDNINENDKLKCFTELLVDVYGSEEEVDILKQEVDNMQQKLTKIDEELTYNTELPKSIQNLQSEIENCKVYHSEMIEHSNAHLSIKNALLGEINTNKELLKTLMNENKNLELKVASQKDVRNEYLYAFERQKQILEEIDTGQQRNKELEEEILTLNLEIDKLKSQLDSFLSDINDLRNLFLLTVNESRIYKFLPDRKLNLDDEWQRLMEKLDKIKSIQGDNLNLFYELFRQLRAQFPQIKVQLVETSSQLKNTASLEVVSKYQQWKKSRNRQQQELTDLDSQIQLLWEEKNELEDRHRNECKTLNDQVESMTKESINYEKFLNGKESATKNVSEQIQMLEHEIINKKSTIMKTFEERKREFENYEHRLLSIIDQNQLIFEKRCQQMEKIIENLRNI